MEGNKSTCTLFISLKKRISSFSDLLQIFLFFDIFSQFKDLWAALGYGDKKIYVVKSEDLVVIRHGAPSNAPVTYALSNFDNELWKKLMAAVK